ncbi:hypothetical protein [Paracidovorax wautersii]|uniref:Uncharacterized protein n=1 Tax=Paracidovorax wautersii TaxID=1177982 RepID=A0A1I2GAM8_9BURK|nr:hypothetical protein [Paracidovorax wautersii]SFF14794.1 hypothetical protein SAMN04489711_11462 [Paracidovorax wautersii]
MTARAVLAAGLVSLNLWDTTKQAYNGFGDPLDADKFEIKPNFEEKVSESRSHLDYGQARASVVLPKPTEITIELAAATVEALAMQFQGMVAALTQGSGTFTDANFTVTALDQWLPLGKRSISDQSFALKNGAGSTTYVLGTHYEVNWLRGEVRFKSGASGAPAKNDVLKLTATYGAVEGKKVLGGRVTQVRCQARFDGRNMVDGSPMEVDVWECALGSNNGFDFLGSDFSGITLSGKLVTPPGKTEPYEVRLPGATTA